MHSRQEKALAPVSPSQSEQYLDRADFVIIGNGIAGLTAAVEARRLAPQKRIVMITNQLYPTINTPALKQFAIGKLDREQLLAYPSGTERRERIHVITANVEEIHARSKYVSLNGKRGFGYDKLLIATGSTPSGLPTSTPGRDFDGVMTLHRLENYLNLRRRLTEVRDAVVIGGGVHAIETVMGLLYQNIRVHWLIRGSTLLARIIDQTSSTMVLERIQRAGAQVYTGTEVAGVVGRVGSVAGVITNQGEMIPCQLVLTCTGTKPVLTLAEHCSQPMQLNNGIQVDDHLRTNVEHIFAAGDVAALKNPLTGHYEPRAQWYAATEQGRIAGAMMAANDESALQPFGVPWHATHLGDLSMLTVGEPLKEGSQISTLTDTSSSGYRRLAVVDDRLVGYLSLGKSQPDSLAIKRIIDEGHSVQAITRSLLKGNFDARKYLSQKHTKAAQGIVTRKLPPLARPMVQQRSSTPGDHMLISPTGSAQVVSTPRRTEPLQSPKQPAPPRLPLMEEEQINAFTGRLPAFSNAYEADDPQTGEREQSEINAFTGNLPFVSGVSNRDLFYEETPIAPTLIPAPATLIPIDTPDWDVKTTRKLLSYAEEIATTRKRPQTKEPSKHTKGLWAYESQEKR